MKTVCWARSWARRSIPTRSIIGIKKVGEGLRIVGSTNDGIPEALESEDGLVYAVQWHPEDLYADYPVFKGLFTRLIELASKE